MLRKINTWRNHDLAKEKVIAPIFLLICGIFS
ncbi:hypothetical protein ETAA8_29660 [Anatilimnocola aggregata]|uniref:Uncharacterized protein n=1 Tax=Anatilimnocola aggregata TaxID=2528021 RepID=A0A517YCA4_9BACT|nr:hypothetical protein ETAA8_29660 [Anatilimnocola aggregata]